MVSNTDSNANQATGERESSAADEVTSHGAEEKIAESTIERLAASPEQAVAVVERTAKRGKTGRKRTALGILKENVDKLAKDLSIFRKNDEVSAKKLEKQFSQLHSEVASLKSHVSKENATNTARLSKMLAKLSARPKGKSAKKGNS